MRFNFGDQAYKEASVNLNSQELVNFYAVPGGPSAKDTVAIYGTPGFSMFSNIGNQQIRAMRVVGFKLYAIAGNIFYEVSTAGAATSRGTIGTSSGRVAISDNGTQVIICDGSAGYIYTIATTTLAVIADADFNQNAWSTTFLGSYFIVTKPDSSSFWWSAVNDGTTWSALDFATAEYSSDNLQTALECYGELWLLGEKSTEVWANVFFGSSPFSRVEGAKSNWGCNARYSVAKIENSLIWLANPPDGGTPQVIATNGYRPTPISTPAMDYELTTYTTTADAYAYAYKDSGHQFYVITFPSQNVTWCYDFLTQRWHKRSSLINGSYVEHNSFCYVYFSNKHLIGDIGNGHIYEMSIDIFTENGAAIQRKVTSPPIFDPDNNRVIHDRLQLDFESGTGTQTVDPTVMLEWSDDGGHSYGNEIWRTIGKAGEYNSRAIWHGLGAARSRVYRLTVTDSVAWRLVSSNLKLRGCRS